MRCCSSSPRRCLASPRYFLAAVSLPRPQLATVRALMPQLHTLRLAHMPQITCLAFLAPLRRSLHTLNLHLCIHPPLSSAALSERLAVLMLTSLRLDRSLSRPLDRGATSEPHPARLHSFRLGASCATLSQTNCTLTVQAWLSAMAFHIGSIACAHSIPLVPSVRVHCQPATRALRDSHSSFADPPPVALQPELLPPSHVRATASATAPARAGKHLWSPLLR